MEFIKVRKFWEPRIGEKMSRNFEREILMETKSFMRFKKENT